MSFVGSQNMRIDAVMSPPQRTVLTLTPRMGLDLLLGLGTTYPQEQVFKRDHARL